MARASPARNGTPYSSLIDIRETAASTTVSSASPEHYSGIDYAQLLHGLMSQVLSSIPASLRRKFLEAEVRPECTAGLLRALRGFQNLEPWAIRLFDASGKYPTGLFEGSHVDMGAFDECLRTVVRDDFGNVLSQGQYCNLLIYVNNGTAFEEMLESFSEILHPRPSIKFMLAVVFLLASTSMARASPARNGTPYSSLIDIRETAASMTVSSASPEHYSGIDYAQLLHGLMSQVLSSIPASLRRKFLEAEVRPECTAGLLRALRGFQNLEPWAIRLFDASGKYPTGLFEGSHVDMGAFDECLRTVVRDDFGNVLSQGQYCNLLIYVNNGTAFEEMLESFSEILHPRRTQASLGTDSAGGKATSAHALLIRLGTLLVSKEYFVTHQCSSRALRMRRSGDGHRVASRSKNWLTSLSFRLNFLPPPYGSRVVDRSVILSGALVHFITAFSATSNTRCLLKAGDRAKPDHYALQFLHGMRFFGIVHIVMGHCGSVMSDTWCDRKTLVFGVFGALSLLGCVAGACVVARLQLLPFMMFPGPLPDLTLRTLSEYYIRPYYHAVCYFGG
ncbi:hypothetical protein HPB51_001807 [Rhipicephalus microplus]|uniref:Nose resistant-to-fluoxetine protein N-terminal domain-containing protein n=1 Tax=Rhipicephalus microplus TaxID=6941 RepID=A0A9J6EWG2_RHIMP|nr:hypothetical protein HPB51_001807 [Rhipicephalus microplus]